MPLSSMQPLGIEIFTLVNVLTLLCMPSTLVYLSLLILHIFIEPFFFCFHAFFHNPLLMCLMLCTPFCHFLHFLHQFQYFFCKTLMSCLLFLPRYYFSFDSTSMVLKYSQDDVPPSCCMLQISF